MRQLTLAIALRPEADFAGYVPGPNAEAVAAVAALAKGTGDAFLYLFGPSGTGKTHLLQAACRVAAERAALYVPLAHPGLEPAVLEDLEHSGLVALDDIQAVAGEADWERALFDLFNRLREASRHLLVSAGVPLAALALELPDLRSRLGWGPGYRLRPLGEEDCRRLLAESARRRGLVLGTNTLDYIMRRCPRDPRSLLGLLEEIDRLSLEDKRRPSLWLIQQLLERRDGPLA